ncbi:MAG: ATP synthase F0 subunit C [bacterium]|nr:ATP synthase F0 subunit C [bacterium]
MDAETINLLSIALIMVFGVVGPSIAIGNIGSSAMKGISRNPEAASKIQTNMVLAIAFAEALGIYALVVSLILKFV